MKKLIKDRVNELKKMLEKKKNIKGELIEGLNKVDKEIYGIEATINDYNMLLYRDDNTGKQDN